MTFAFKNKDEGTVVHVQSEDTPLIQYQRDPKYQKLYEEAHVQVYIIRCLFYMYIGFHYDRVKNAFVALS